MAGYASDAPEQRLEFPFRQAMVLGVNIRLVFVYLMSQAAHEDAVRDVTAALRSGAYAPHIGLRLPLAEVARGHEAQDSGTLVGKAVFSID